jgi:hypothetical protein
VGNPLAPRSGDLRAKVQGGLRRALLTQAKRLQWLSVRRYEALGGAASVTTQGDGEET